MKFYVEPFYQITPHIYVLLQLNKVHPEIKKNRSNYLVDNDDWLNLSGNFISIMLPTQIAKDTMESTLINYDVDGKYIDHLLLSAAHKSKEALRVSHFGKTRIYVEIETTKQGKTVLQNHC
ncbi:MAG: hypothetical protein ACI9SG_000161 [Maribacter sp.]|jgi:hypothetical protein